MRNIRWARAIQGLITLLLCLTIMTVANAQLAGSFLNITSISTRVLPNAVQVVINTDGAVSFGTDLNEWTDSSAGFNSKATQAFRIRVVNARARIPANIPIGAYPIDAIRVTPGRTPIGNPYFNNGVSPDTDPRVDLELNFDVPINVRRFQVDRGRNVTFSNALGPREVSVELGQDRRSIVVTVVPDRSDTDARFRMDRSPFEERKHQLDLERTGDRYTLRSLNTPLADVLKKLSESSGRSLAVRPRSAGIAISLFLPSATINEILGALQTGYGLDAHPGDDKILFDRGENPATERFALMNLKPERARLLFPDFLLPSLRADTEGNALLGTASPAVLRRVRRDLKVLDTPRRQIRVLVQGWEISASRDADQALKAARTGAGYGFAFDTKAATATVSIGAQAAKSFSLTLDALRLHGWARLAVSPQLMLLQGEQGSLFLGQQRYIKVLQQSGGDQILTALPLSIGYSLDVTATAVSADSVSLDIAPRISTVDSTELTTGLPTLGIRQIRSSVQLGPGEAALITGLDLDLDSMTEKSIFPLDKRTDTSRTKLVLLVTATLV